MYKIKRLGVFSVARTAAVMYFMLGVIIAVPMFAFMGIASRLSGTDSPLAGFGAAALLLVPVVYGILGFIMTAIMAALYNLVAGWMGGIEMEFEVAPVAGYPPAVPPSRP